MKYTAFVSDIELPFYTALANNKINHDKLSDSARSVLGLYEIRATDPANISCRMQIHGNALTSTEWVDSMLFKCCVPVLMLLLGHLQASIEVKV